MEWLPISEYKPERVVIRWHKIWKCPIAVFLKTTGPHTGQWLEKTLGCSWPEMAFHPTFATMPECPKD